jgi:hypothetical protein
MRDLAAHISESGGTCNVVVFDDDTHSLARHRPEVRHRTGQFFAQLTADWWRAESDTRGTRLSL